MTDTLQSPLEGAVLFYKQPEPLDPALHQTLGVNAAEKPYAFVGQTNFVPLTVTEFAAAARDAHLIVIPAGDNVVRLLPPLNLTLEEAREAVEKIERACERARQKAKAAA